MVGRYTLLSKVGEGGMGVVHLAEYPPGHHVAIKLLRPHVVSDDHGRARMAREVTSLRRVRSPRVAEVYDADPWGETPYIVTRFVPGPSLQDRVESSGPLRGGELQRFASGLAEALAAVHHVGVLHRDIKPSNVLLDGADPVLIDFGLAQLCDDARITYSGWLLGTPGYLAPEILYGEGPTPQADVHSWAATVVYAATGRGPYGKGPAVAVMDRVRRGEHDLSAVPDSLYWIVRQCLSPDPRDRPSSRQLADWLAGWVAQTRAEATDRSGDTSRTLLHPAQVAPVGSAAAGPAPAGAAWAVPGVPRARSATPTAYQPATLAGQPAGPVQEGLVPAVRRQPGIALRMLFWGAIGCLVVAGFLTAPVPAAGAVCIAAWMLRTVAVRAGRLQGWRARRGYRRGDSYLATACTPWFAVVALPGAVVNAAVALVDAALVVLVATLATPPRALVYVLALGGLATGVFVYWGPFSRETRAGGAMLAGAALRSRATTVVTLVLVSVAVVGLLMTRQVVGPAYAPIPAPPWGHSLRSSLP
jgi:Protein kinase domain